MAAACAGIRNILRSLRRFLACLVIASLLWSAAFPFRAEAGAFQKEAARMAALAALLTAEYFIEESLLKDDKKVTEAIEKILSQTALREVARIAEYEIDHKPLTGGDVVFRDLTSSVGDAKADMVLAMAAFLLLLNPGYRESAEGDINFAEAYKNRAAAWRLYALSALKTNNKEAEGTFETQNLMKKLYEASESAYGYTQLMQAGGQTSNFASQELARVRLDTQRQLEVETSIALNERQERADLQAAFDQAVREWRNQHGGNGY